MKIGNTLYLTKRNVWRKWLTQNHDKESEVWLVFYKKHTKRPNLDYGAAVEEALCFGWIDSIVKRIDEDKNAQRFSPRKTNSVLSSLNRERVFKMIKQKKMTKVGLEKLKNQLSEGVPSSKDILKEIKSNKKAWINFNKFDAVYKRIRIGWIEGARKRPEEFKKRLDYFIQKTAQNKKFGQMP